MVETLKHWDESLLHLINQDMANPFFDGLMPFITDLHKTWGFQFVFLPLLFVFLVYKKKYWGVLFFLFLTLAIATSDFLGGHIIKPFFERPRPPVAGIEVILRAQHFGGFSFPSNHALNMFCAAMFLSLTLPRFRIWFFIFAALVAYSRVYCGVHYPSDVLFGAVVGAAIGGIFYLLFKGVQKWLKFL